MPSNISIKERILRQVRTTCAAVTGVAAAYRWDTGRWWNGSAWVETMPRNSIMVAVESDDVVGEGLGTTGPTMKQMNLSVGIKLVRDSDDTTVYDSLVRRWENDIEKALLADPFIAETATGVRLAADSRVTTLPGPQSDSGQPEVVPSVILQIDYRHNRTDPSVLGTTITAVTES